MVFDKAFSDFSIIFAQIWSLNSYFLFSSSMFAKFHDHLQSNTIYSQTPGTSMYVQDAPSPSPLPERRLRRVVETAEEVEEEVISRLSPRRLRLGRTPENDLKETVDEFPQVMLIDLTFASESRGG